MVKTASFEDRIAVSAAARILELSENSVRQLADRGALPCERVSHFRTFSRADVLKLAAERAAAALNAAGEPRLESQ